VDDPKEQRILERVQRLLDHRKKLERNLEAGGSDHPKAKAWLAKLAEVEESLANFQRYGQERPPSGNVRGVDIHPETHKISIVKHGPGGAAPEKKGK
jgi:hypothetical protein